MASNPRVGLRVRVTSVDDTVLDERGTIVGLAAVDVLGRRYARVPIIRTDSGRELAGFECWWTPVAAEDGGQNG